MVVNVVFIEPRDKNVTCKYVKVFRAIIITSFVSQTYSLFNINKWWLKKQTHREICLHDFWKLSNERRFDRRTKPINLVDSIESDDTK